MTKNILSSYFPTEMKEKLWRARIKGRNKGRGWKKGSIYRRKEGVNNFEMEETERGRESGRRRGKNVTELGVTAEENRIHNIRIHDKNMVSWSEKEEEEENQYEGELRGKK